MACNCNASSTYSAGGPGCPDCRPKHSCCEPANPCSNELPTSCEPLGGTTQGSGIVVEDSAFCKKTLQKPLHNSLLWQSSNGNALLRDGSSTQPITLEWMQSTDTNVRTLVGRNSAGELIALTPPVEDGKILVGGASVFELVDFSDLFQGPGIVYVDALDGSVKYLPGTENDIVTFDSDGNPTTVDPDTLLTGGSITACGITITNANNDCTIAARYVVLEDGSGNFHQVRNVAQVINRLTSGANGIDTGSVGAGVIYWVYVIYNPTTDTVSAVASTNSGSPTLPSGYTFYRKIGATCTNFSSQFMTACSQNGNELTVYAPNGTFSSGNTGLVGRTIDYTTLATSGTIVPPVSPSFVSAYKLSLDYLNTTSGTTAARTSIDNSSGGVSVTDNIQLFATRSTVAANPALATQTDDDGWLVARSSSPALAYTFNGSSIGTDGAVAFLVCGYRWNFI